MAIAFSRDTFFALVKEGEESYFFHQDDEDLIKEMQGRSADEIDTFVRSLFEERWIGQFPPKNQDAIFSALKTSFTSIRGLTTAKEVNRRAYLQSVIVLIDEKVEKIKRLRLGSEIEEGIFTVSDEPADTVFDQ